MTITPTNEFLQHMIDEANKPCAGYKETRIFERSGDTIAYTHVECDDTVDTLRARHADTVRNMATTS